MDPYSTILTLIAEVKGRLKKNRQLIIFIALGFNNFYSTKLFADYYKITYFSLLISFRPYFRIEIKKHNLFGISHIKF
jgi:hypothetical protein